LLDSAAYRLLAIILSNGLWKAAGTGFFSDGFCKSIRAVIFFYRIFRNDSLFGFFNEHLAL